MGIHTALDTCGRFPAEAFDPILPLASLVLFDIKEIDPERHRQFTGHGNGTILANLRRLADVMRQSRSPEELWIRTPVIPGMTDREETITGIGRFIAETVGDVVSRWELCAFNNLCADKYRRLGTPWPLENVRAMPGETMERLARVARRAASNLETVLWTGPVHVGE